ncbi:MAG: hypothetical protein VX278_07400 [Myxococcota bacterium]|nr:hypothetical protein [Myxococcota bacterium]
MTEMILLPILSLFTLWLLNDYLRTRLNSVEDRYMEHYGKDDWKSSNMELVLQCTPQNDKVLKQRFQNAISRYLDTSEGKASLLYEVARTDGEKLAYETLDFVQFFDLLQPRNGVYFDMSQTGKITVVWSHIQCDGVGIWRTLRPLFDANPPLIPYRKIPPPPPFIPELFALPIALRNSLLRSQLRAPEQARVHKGHVLWRAETFQSLKRRTKIPFNLLSSAKVVENIFQRHPETQALNVGLTVYFPFLKSRNKYGVILARVKRDSMVGIAKQLYKQSKNPIQIWGNCSLQSYTLNRLPKSVFLNVMSYYRKQIDVLISNLPVGKNPITLCSVPTNLACYSPELSLPYYFLLMGTRSEIHVSYSSKFPQRQAFLHSESLNAEAKSFITAD